MTEHSSVQSKSSSSNSYEKFENEASPLPSPVKVQADRRIYDQLIITDVSDNESDADRRSLERVNLLQL